jgi:hypothetical protein
LLITLDCLHKYITRGAAQAQLWIIVPIVKQTVSLRALVTTLLEGLHAAAN